MGPVFDVPALKHLKYMMRIDGEDGFYKYDKEDPFLVMDKGPHGTYPYKYNHIFVIPVCFILSYAYYWTGFDPPLYSVGLNEMMYDYVAKNNIKPYWDENYIRTKGKDRAPMFWTNWEITRTDYFRTKPVRDLAKAVPLTNRFLSVIVCYYSVRVHTFLAHKNESKTCPFILRFCELWTIFLSE